MTVLAIAWACVACGGQIGASPGGLGDGGAGGAGNDAGAGGTGGMEAPGGESGQGGIGTGGVGGAPVDDDVALFVAQGHVGRTLISCDDGRTWVANQAADTDAPVACFVNDVDCDHRADTARGITYGNGWFFVTFGWGSGGAVKRSRDGVQWDPIRTGFTYANLAYGNGVLMLGDRSPVYSEDDGANWLNGGDTNLAIWNARRIGFVPHAGGRFVITGEGTVDNVGVRDVVLSEDNGKNWWHPDTLPASCAAGVMNEGGVLYGAGTMVIVGGDGVVCRSVDGGKIWEATSLGTSVSSPALWTGSQFVVWSTGKFWHSADGASWESTNTEPSNVSIGAVARSESGTFAAVNAGWQQWYDKQVFYRSADGITWQALERGTDFVGSHPVSHMTFGRGKRSSHCP